MVVPWVLKKLQSHVCGKVFGAEVWNMDMCRQNLGYKATVLCFVAIPCTCELTLRY